MGDLFQSRECEETTGPLDGVDRAENACQTTGVISGASPARSDPDPGARDSHGFRPQTHERHPDHLACACSPRSTKGSVPILRRVPIASFLNSIRKLMAQSGSLRRANESSNRASYRHRTKIIDTPFLRTSSLGNLIGTFRTMDRSVLIVDSPRLRVEDQDPNCIQEPNRIQLHSNRHAIPIQTRVVARLTVAIEQLKVLNVQERIRNHLTRQAEAEVSLRLRSDRAAVATGKDPRKPPTALAAGDSPGGLTE